MQYMILRFSFFNIKNELFEKNDVKIQMHQRGVVHFYFKLHLTNQEIHAHLKDVYGDEAMSMKSVEYWTHQFKLGRTDDHKKKVIGF